MNEELLKALHILTKDGKMNADSRRKLKQVHHLAQLIEPFLQSLNSKSEADWILADLGAGKSYLGFILYDLVVRNLKNGHILAIEARPELVESSRQLALATGFERMKFVEARIGDAADGLPAQIDVVTALHACDTATDDSITFGIKHGARVFALVPCCQAEVARQFEPLTKKAMSGSLDPADLALVEFPIHRREFGSHLTNVIRVLYLKSRGYKVTVTELVGWEHSMKNELILAEKVSDASHPESKRAQAELDSLLKRFKVRPKLIQSQPYPL